MSKKNKAKKSNNINQTLNSQELLTKAKEQIRSDIENLGRIKRVKDYLNTKLEEKRFSTHKEASEFATSTLKKMHKKDREEGQIEIWIVEHPSDGTFYSTIYSGIDGMIDKLSRDLQQGTRKSILGNRSLCSRLVGDDHAAIIASLDEEGVFNNVLPQDQIDNLARYFVSLPDELAFELWRIMGKGEANNIVNLHKTEIDGENVSKYFVKVINKMDAWKGKQLGGVKDVEEIDGELFWVKTIRWENHEETTREAWSESDYSKFLNADGTFSPFTRERYTVTDDDLLHIQYEQP